MQRRPAAQFRLTFLFAARLATNAFQQIQIQLPVGAIQIRHVHVQSNTPAAAQK